MIKVEVNQTLLPRQAQVLHVWLARLLRMIAAALRLRGTHTLSVAFVNHRTMQRLNRTYRNKDRVTDILSFAEVGERNSLGELILAWPYVRDQAKKNKKSLTEELALLLIHGVLHLRGYDHETKKDAAKMEPLQNRILKDFLKI